MLLKRIKANNRNVLQLGVEKIKSLFNLCLSSFCLVFNAINHTTSCFKCHYYCFHSLDNMFSLTLPSNGSPNTHPENTVATFKTLLADPINLLGAGEYEIGLSEIQHPTLIRNVTDCWVMINRAGTSFDKHYLEDGLYTDGDLFLQKFKETLKKASIKCDLQIGNYNRIVQIWMHEKATLKLSQNLADILGFDNTELENSSADRASFPAQQPYDVNRGLDHIFVYCNLCSDMPLGHTKAPLLRCVKSNISAAPKPQCTTFSKINFTPMSVRNFDSILVYLRLSNGQPVPFMSGSCVVTLVIRRKKKLIF